MDLLNESERRFTKKLCDAMIPSMITTFWEIWLEAKKVSQGKGTLKIFDELLREIKTWNSSISLKHAETIVKTEALFPSLLAAVFVIHVKILSSIRTDKKSKKICIKLPANDVFVQRCYEACAEDIYRRPEVITNSSINEDTRSEQLHERFCVKIHKVIESLIPTAEILQTYLPLPGGDLNLDEDEEEAEDEDIPDMEEEEAPQEPMEAPVNPEVDGVPTNTEGGTPGGVPGAPLDIGQTPGGTKTVNVTPSLNPPKIQEQTLFDDAREK
jgi:hypothetical protein